MSEALFSPHWYRVKALKPRLPSHVRIHRHSIRGQVWWVVHDPMTRRNYRYSAPAYAAIARMDGRHSVQDIWDQVHSEWGDDAPTQDGLIQLLAQLHAADLLQCDVPPDTQDLLRRHHEHEQQPWRQWLRNPLSLRIPLFNPDRLLDRLLPWVQPCLGRAGLLVRIVSVATAVLLASRHWPELAENVLDRVFTPQSLILFGCILPFVKIVHEFGHAFAVKKWGGEVPEMGILLIALLPLPYVDASASNAFPDKYQRMWVAAAGIMVDLFGAAWALFLWLLVEPGLVRTAAYDVMLVGGLSSLFFNGNPLLRYDGYYVFSDLIEVPNLASRASRYWGYLARRHLLGQKTAPSPVTAAGEAAWLSVYGAASWLYRNLVLFGMVLFVVREYPHLGLVLGGMALISQILMPAIRLLLFPFTSPDMAFRRWRSSGVTLAAITLLALVLFAIPLPSWTYTEGVVWLPEDALIRAKTSGVVSRVLVESYEQVARDALLAEIEDPFLQGEQQILAARLAELNARRAAEWQNNQVGANIIQDEFRSVEAEIRRVEDRLAGLRVQSPLDGVIILADAKDLPGRYVRQGELLCYAIAENAPVTVRAMIPQEKISLVRDHTETITVKLVGQADRSYPARLIRQVPQATDKLPSGVLGSLGGGELAVDPQDASGTTLLEKQFQLELAIEDASDPTRLGIGRRAYIRFDHEQESLASQIYRSLRQLFLRQINV